MGLEDLEALVTGAKSNRNKSGQSMVELLLGLIGIAVILLSLDLVAHVVVDDHDSMLDVRSEVARSLVGGGTENGAPAQSQSYAASVVFYSMLLDDIRYDETKELQEQYPPRSEDVNGFEIVAVGDPLSEMVGLVSPVTIPVENEFLRRALGRDQIRKVNAVWVPSWSDLMGEEGDDAED